MAEGGYYPIAHRVAAEPATLERCALAALAGIVPADAVQPELAWLLADGPKKLDLAALLACRAAPGEADRALLRVAEALALSEVEILGCALVLAAETDVRVGRAMACLQGTAAQPGPALPTLGLLARLSCAAGLEPARDDARLARGVLGGNALASGLLQLVRDGRGAVDAALTMPASLLAVLCGRWPAATLSLAQPGGFHATVLAVPDWAMPERYAKAVDQLLPGLAASKDAIVVIRASSTDEAAPLAAWMASRLGKRPVDVAGLIGHGAQGTGAPGSWEPWLVAVDGAPVLRLDAGPGEQWQLPQLQWYRGPVVIAAGAEGEVGTGSRPRFEWNVPWLDRAERAHAWRHALGALDADACGRAQRLALRTRLGWATLHSLCDEVRRHLEETADSSDEAVERALESARARGGRALAPLAQPVNTRIDEAALVMPAGVKDRVQLLLARCEARETLTDTLGPAFAARYSPGVKALLVGASGTGKTLAAQWLAMRLGKPLFRVDLSAVSSKYIGETEKHLAQLLARAESLDAVLLFDEADSLFGARTEVKQANDRFANAQTNYLLARIETFEGIAILTSNSQARFDHAFLRRLDAVIEFPLPSAVERRELWDVHLGDGHALTGEQRNCLAAGIDLAGGHIRNAVLAAALFARGRGEPAIGWDDVVNACAVEYRKLGRSAPDGIAAGAASPVDPVAPLR